MSDPILALLQNENPQQRKRGIAAAAKKGDPRYLKYLARVAKGDPEAELRKLAKKAGTYIHQQQKATAAPADDLDSLRAAATAGTSAPAVAQPSAPPADMPDLQALIQDGKRETDPVQAEAHYNNAFDLHLKGQNAHAALELGTAFYLNPAYANDATAVAFAAEMTGMDRAQAVQYIANPDNWRDLTNKHGGFKRKSDQPGDRGELQSLYLWFAGAVLLLIVIGGVVWLFQSGLIGEAIQQARFGPPPTAMPAATVTPQ